MQFRKVFIFSVILLMFLSIASINAENITDVNSTGQIKTYTDLSTQITDIDDGGVLNLTEKYGYDPNNDTDLIDGVKISKNMTIKGSNSSYIDGSNLARGLFIDSHCSVVLENLIFKNCYSNSSGGGVYLTDNSNLTIRNCTFLNNSVYNSDGGAVDGETGTHICIDSCVFEGNDAIRESDLEWDDFKAGMGGAICIRIGSTFQLNSSIFRNNRAYLALVLVISYDDVNYKLSTISVRNCLFEKNEVRRCGIIYEDERGSGEVLDSIFRNNVLSETGTVLDLDACIDTIVRNCTFEGNSAKSGGAIRLKLFKSKYVSHVSIIDCVFTNNSANNGGAIYSDTGEFNIENCVFNQNTAVKKGGAIYAFNGTVKISGSKFSNNAATNGGALDLNGQTTIINDCSFTKNSVSKKGGAIYTESGSLKLSNSQFDQNAAANGGSLYLNKENSVINDCSFNNNRVSKKGGAIYAESGSLKLSNSQFDQNAAANGGALYLNKESSVINVCTFNKNSASSKGGAIISESGSLKLSNSKFNQNTAANGGGLYMNSEGGTVSDCTFSKNSANSKGGAIYSTIKSVKASNIKYSSNTAAAAPKVYGTFNGKVKQYTYTTKSVMLKIKITSPWKMSVSQKVQIKLTGPKTFTSKWLKTNSNGIVKVIVPFNVKISKYKLTISMQNGVCYVKSWSKVKVDAKVVAPKKVKKPSKIKLKIKNKLSKTIIPKKKFKIKLYTGKSYKVYKIKTNSKGILKIKTAKLTKGKHKIIVILNDNDYNIKRKVKVKVI